MSCVVYLIDQPFDDRNYDRFGIQAWLDRHWNVEVWDLTPWANARMWRDFTGYGREPRRFAGYFAIGSARELARRRRASGAIRYFIDLTSDSLKTLRARLPLVRSGAVRITCSLGAIPTPDPTYERGIRGRFRRALALGPRAAMRALRDTAFSKAAAVLTAPGLVVVAGRSSLATNDPVRPVIRAHNFDYDIYLKVAQAHNGPEPGYAVFVDQDYCFHPEFTCKESSTIITPARYFPTVCNGLRTISAALAMPVRIAAHPRATYQQRGRNYFDGFQLEYGRTAELIRDASAVICHDSTAIQFAVLFAKPLIFVTTDELIRTYEGRSISKVAVELGKLPINLDGDLRDVDWRAQLTVDAGKYTTYRTQYIKSDGSPEIPVWHIVIDRVENVGEPRR